MSDKVIPIVRHVPSRAALRKSFSESNYLVVHLIAHIQDAVKGNDDRFFGLCDELRGELNELAGILIDYVTPGFLDDKYGRKQNLRTLVLMVSHIELMFLYAQKNRASVMHYRREIDATVEEFLHCYARIAESVVL